MGSEKNPLKFPQRFPAKKRKRSQASLCSSGGRKQAALSLVFISPGGGHLAGLIGTLPFAQKVSFWAAPKSAHVEGRAIPAGDSDCS